MTDYERWNVPKRLKKNMHLIASDLRQRSTPSETILWEAIRNRKLEGRKFRRQVPIGAFVLDFYCAEERMAIEIDGGIHETQKQADALRQETLESLNIRFVRVSADDVEHHLNHVLNIIRSNFEN